MRITKYLALILLVLLGVLVLRVGKVHAQNPAGPPDSSYYPAYNFGANGFGTGWGYSVPQDFRYPPAVGWNPITNKYDGKTNPSGNIEDLCRGPKKLLVPNMGTAFPSTTDGNKGFQWGPYAYTSYSDTIYVEYWSAAYQCWNSPADAGSAHLENTWLEVDLNGTAVAIQPGFANGSKDPDKGGWGADWKGTGMNVGGLNPGINSICMKTRGEYQWTEGGKFQSEGYGWLGYGCTYVYYDVPPAGNLDAVDCNLASGWAKDPDWPAVQPGDPNSNKFKTLHVKIYKDNWPENGGAYVAEGQADQWRPDVGVHGYKIDISSAKGWSSNRFYAVAEGFDEFGNLQGYFHLGGGGKEAGPCQQLTCGNLTPFIVEPTEPFNISIDAGASGNAPPGGVPFTINVSVTGIYSGSLNGVIPAGTRSGVVTAGPFSNSSLGVHNATFTITYLSRTVGPCTGSVTIAAKPTFTVNNGDITSGFSSGAANCSTTADPNKWASSNGNSKLLGWNYLSSSPSQNKGSGTNLATIALSQIDGVSSTRSSTTLPLPLSFANDTSTGTYGGKYGGGISCPKDYYGQSANVTTSLPANSSTTVPVTDTKTTGYTTLNASTLGSGTRSALYVDGDVYINGDITLNNGGVSTPSGLANFYLVVRGNIYIDPGVKKLDGVYIAQGSTQGATSKGQIYTCAQKLTATNFVPPTANMVNSNDDDSPNSCRKNDLTVNGAFIADKLNLYRSKGTLYQGIHAETFNYTPASWLAPPASIAPLFGGSTGTTTGSYDAITTLQPVL